MPTLGIGSSRISEKDGMEMVYVPAGDLLMGTDSGDFAQRPEHIVYLDTYWIDKYEVTNTQYQKCVNAQVCNPPSVTKDYSDLDYARHPVVYVNWYQAQAYCRFVGRDLPTEGQWEKAARGEDGRYFPWGNELANENLLNYNGNIGETTIVGSYPSAASPYGAMDMAGNVSEWVSDWYSETYYREQTTWSNPQGPSKGIFKVQRGGSWLFVGSAGVTSFQRNRGDPAYTDFNFGHSRGFRCALSEASP